MIASISLLLCAASITLASPVLELRTVTSLNQAAFAQAQQRDDTATRAFSGTEIKTSTGQCLFVNELSGDFRANLNPIQVAPCDGSAGQLWDIITAGKHNDEPGTMLIVNTLTQACMNFDQRRAPGNRVIMFSCGGRADGGGSATPSQLFPFSGGAGPLSLQPVGQTTTTTPQLCLAVVSGNVLDNANCNSADATQSFTFGGVSGGSASVSAAPASNATSPAVPSAAPALVSISSTGCIATTTVTVTRSASSSITSV